VFVAPRLITHVLARATSHVLIREPAPSSKPTTPKPTPSTPSTSAHSAVALTSARSESSLQHLHVLPRQHHRARPRQATRRTHLCPQICTHVHPDPSTATTMGTPMLWPRSLRLYPPRCYSPSSWYALTRSVATVDDDRVGACYVPVYALR